MKVLLIGVGGVGEAITKIIQERDPNGDWLEVMVLADYDLERAEYVAEKLVDRNRFPVERIDATKNEEIAALAKKYDVDLMLNATSAFCNKAIFNTALEMGCHYMDLGTYSIPHPTEPGTKGYQEWMGEYQFSKSAEWEKANLLAVTGCGIDPGTVDVFAKYAEKHLFDELYEIRVRDGNNLKIEGLDLAFGFSVWTVIDECLNPPVFWEKDKGWYVKEPLADLEVFEMPEGIGPVEMVAVEHEEVVFMPKYIDKGLKKVDFKIQLGQELIDALKYLRALGLDKREKVTVGDVEVSPRDLVAVTAPNPAHLGARMTGKMCVGVSVTGKKDGKEREVFIYQTFDNQESMERLGCQAVVSQTAYGPVMTMELIAKGLWKKSGVHAPEAFEPEPYLSLMDQYSFPYSMEERDSEFKRSLDEECLRKGLEEYEKTMVIK